MTTALAIEASGLVKAFGATKAVDGVDLAVRRGSVYGVLGPNGAGKTTTIRMLATLLRPDSGSARVLGHDIVAEADAVRGRGQPHGPACLGRRGPDRPREPRSARPAARLQSRPSQRSGGRAARGLRPRGRGRPTGQELLGRNAAPARHRGEPGRHPGVDVPRRAHHRLGPALTQPGLGHHPGARAEGTTILLCTQYLDEADQLADGIAVIDRGKVIAEGTPGQLKASVGSGSAARAPARPRPATRGRARPGAGARHGPPGIRPRGSVGVVRRRRSRRPGGCGAVARRASGVADFSLGQPSLDEVFLALTGHPAEDTTDGKAGARMSVDPGVRSHGPRAPPKRRCARRSPRAPGQYARVPCPQPHVRLARDAQGQARARAADRRDVHARAVHADVHLHLRRRDRRLHRAITSSSSCRASW